MIIRVVRLALFAGVVALVGCTDAAGEPSTLPDVTAPPSATPAVSETQTPSESTTTAEPPVEPDNAHAHSAEGVEAFTLYAIEVINYAYQTNDVTYLEQISSDDCQFCDNAIHRLTTISNAGGHVEGGVLVPDLRRLSISGPTDGVQTSAGVELMVTASKIIDGQGNLTHTEPDRERYYIFNLAREGDLWKLKEVSRADGSSS
ncbi:MAG TPA: DUF6318 family protein [Jiangellaceae bacterium]